MASAHLYVRLFSFSQYATGACQAATPVLEHKVSLSRRKCSRSSYTAIILNLFLTCCFIKKNSLLLLFHWSEWSCMPTPQRQNCWGQILDLFSFRLRKGALPRRVEAGKTCLGGHQRQPQRPS